MYDQTQSRVSDRLGKKITMESKELPDKVRVQGYANHIPLQTGSFLREAILLTRAEIERREWLDK